MLLNPRTKTTCGDSPPPAEPATMANEVKIPSRPPKIIGFKKPPSLWCQSSSLLPLSSWYWLKSSDEHESIFQGKRLVSISEMNQLVWRQCNIYSPRGIDIGYFISLSGWNLLPCWQKRTLFVCHFTVHLGSLQFLNFDDGKPLLGSTSSLSCRLAS